MISTLDEYNEVTSRLSAEHSAGPQVLSPFFLLVSGSPTSSSASLSMHQDEGDSDNRLWGFLTPLDRARLKRMDFKLDKRAYTIGRYRGHDFRLPWSTICKTHCVVEWDGIKSPSLSQYQLTRPEPPLQLNGKLIGKKKCALLRDGDEISFLPCCEAQYRYVYRQLTPGQHVVTLDLVYKLGKEIGRGAYATVFKATHRTERRSYAIKVIRRDGLREFMTTDGASIYEREIAALETLFHPNICYMKEVFYTRGNISFVMEFIAGGDLWKYMGKCGRMKEPEAQRIAFQLFDAVSYIHAHGIAHRDLKPENVLMTADNPPIVKLADFGLSKVIEGPSLLQTMCGTPLYVAPEVVNQQKHEGYNLVVDCWSLGIIVFEMLMDHSAFSGEEGMYFGTWINGRKVQWDIMRRSGIARAAQSLIRHLLEVDPRKRLTASCVRKHRWLADQARVHGIRQYAGGLDFIRLQVDFARKCFMASADYLARNYLNRLTMRLNAFSISDIPESATWGIGDNFQILCFNGEPVTIVVTGEVLDSMLDVEDVRPMIEVKPIFEGDLKAACTLQGRFSEPQTSLQWPTVEITRQDPVPTRFRDIFDDSRLLSHNLFACRMSADDVQDGDIVTVECFLTGSENDEIHIGVRGSIYCLDYDVTTACLAVGIGQEVHITHEQKEHEYSGDMKIPAPPILRHVASDVDQRLRAVAVHFHKNGTNLIVSYLIHGIVCWSIATRSRLWTIVPPIDTPQIGSSALSPDGRNIIVYNLVDGVHSYVVGSFKKQMPRHQYKFDVIPRSNHALKVAYLHAGRALVCGTTTGNICIWNTASKEYFQLLGHNDDTILAIDASILRGDFSYVVTASAGKGKGTYVKIWRSKIAYVHRDDDLGDVVVGALNAVSQDNARRGVVIVLTAAAFVGVACGTYAIGTTVSWSTGVRLLVRLLRRLWFTSKFLGSELLIIAVRIKHGMVDVHGHVRDWILERIRLELRQFLQIPELQ
ncbi:Calcium/calmodulin-dependent protein kinase type 1 [Grifola frondosa]|uniref:Calcium/calmodulin-dependent protein kinase type 1 n=1 Tax=Grifola frondosa TaxID=5627 RepID=A0A1C7MNV3_GRIFR|nr:Calcium/calmodulin-dependent protein kinase type 1 [Grifola frondosa]